MRIGAAKAEFIESVSYLKHKKQRFWQILFPVGLGIVLILALGTLIVLTAAGGEGAGGVSQWADASLIWLILPVMVVAVVIAVILMALIYLAARGLRILPPYARIAQQYGVLVSAKARFLADKLVSPIMGIRSMSARMGAIFSALFGRFRK